MKKSFLIFVFFVATAINAQISNIAELASGKLEMFTPIIELNGNVYGYFSIYKLEKVSKTEEKYEYVLLDKNLNKVANGEYTDVRYKRYNTNFYYPEKIGNKLVLSKQHYVPYIPKFTFVTHRILDLKTNKISEEFYYEKGELINGSRSTEKIKRHIKKLKTYEYPLGFSKGFFLFEKMKNGNQNLKEIKGLKAFDINKNKKWEYTYNPDKKPLDFRFEIIEDNNIIFWTFDQKTKSQVLHSINPNTGKANFTYELENKSSKYNHLFKVRSLKNKFIIVGKMSPFKKSGYNYEKALGLFRIELDKKGNEISKKYFNWEEANKFLEIKKNGKLKNGYRLLTKQFFVFEDGSSAFLAEKSKDSQNFVFVVTASKTTDFVMLNFDKNFNLKKVETIEKEKTKWFSSDYLYSQKIKGGKGVVFFYRDYKKDPESKKKNWILGIVTIINGKMTHEQIPMTSKEHSIFPYIAKEGYILLREYNKDADYDQIRLERLNY